ncbi:MAG: regulatory protein RecX [Lachnospiraceae bacterium]|nr:regulatory protein RecX [Lachnospiraceae bacterium]
MNTAREGADRSDAEKEVILLAKKKALKLLDYMDRTERQLRDKLKEGGFPPFAVDEAVEYVRAHHYIDDLRYAKGFIETRKDSRSRFELKHMLKERGISDVDIEQALEEAELDDRTPLEHLFRKKYAGKDPADPKTYEKAFRYFSTKGYRYEDIKAALLKVLSENDPESGF